MRTPKSFKKKHFVNALGATSDSGRESELWESSIEVQMSLTNPQTISSSRSERPPNVKQAKEDLGNGKTCEHATWAQAQAYLEMAKATHMKA